MNTLLALTINIPDWLFCGPFWAGFFTAIGLGIAFLMYALSNFRPFGWWDAFQKILKLEAITLIVVIFHDAALEMMVILLKVDLSLITALGFAAFAIVLHIGLAKALLKDGLRLVHYQKI